ncbi:MAG: hypothetical protein AAGL96_08400 [Pseudomonadota bacterium]
MNARKHAAAADLEPASGADPIAFTDADQARLIRDDRKPRLASYGRARLAIGLSVILALALLTAAGFVANGVEAGQ